MINPLIRLMIAFIGVSILLVSFVHDHLKLKDCKNELFDTKDQLALCVAERDGCRQGVHEFVAEMEKVKSQSKQEQIPNTPTHWQTNQPEAFVTNDVVSLSTNLLKAQEAAFLMDYKSMIWMTNRSDLVNLSRNGQTILTVDPNFNVLVHGTKIGRITETNWTPEPLSLEPQTKTSVNPK